MFYFLVCIISPFIFPYRCTNSTLFILLLVLKLMHMSYIRTYAKANSTKKWGNGEDFENGSSKWTDPNCGKIVHCVASRGCWGRLAGWPHKILYNTLASYGIVDVPVVTWAFPFHELFPSKSRWWYFFTVLITTLSWPIVQQCTSAQQRRQSA